ncbi:hypothetical protein VT84_33385 [Gemmata sp. SH-PL17]|nr:hypothetical protein VT84_33385 [Gemmata sp. SH-PL17]
MTTARRKWISRSAVATFAVVLVATGLRFQPIEPSVQRSRLDAVTVGMTRAQVWETVGVPPGTYPEDLAYFDRVGIRCGDDRWTSAEGTLHVFYDSDGRVSAAIVYETHVIREDGSWW